MSHERTTEAMTEAVSAEMQAIVQALVSEPNTPVSVVEADGEGHLARAMEAMRAEVVEQAASRPSVPPALTQSADSDGVKDQPDAAADHLAANAENSYSEAQEGTDMVATAVAERVQTKPLVVKEARKKSRLKVAKAKKAPEPVKRAKSKSVKALDIRPPAGVKVEAKAKRPKTAHAVAVKEVSKKAQQKPLKLSVPEVWRSIVKKNERQGSRRYDVLVCQHAVPANDNTYRVARACPECRMKVQEYADRAGRSAPKRRRAKM